MTIPNPADNLVTPNSEWATRVRALARPEHFDVRILFNHWSDLTIAERERLAAKLPLVVRFATYMAMGMLKGTIKYPADNWTLEEWIAHLMDDGADLAAYQVLLAEAYQRGDR